MIVEGECFPGDAEILTPNGWVRFDEYSGGEVLQINKDFNSEFVLPLSVIKKQYNGKLLEVERGGNYYSKTTPGHNLVYVDKTGIKKRKIKDMPRTVQGYIPTVTRLDGPGIPLTNKQIALCLAVSADVTIDERIGNGYRKYPRSIRYGRVSFRKERKVKRLTEILDTLKIEYTCNPVSRGYTSICFPIPHWCCGKTLSSEWIWQASLEQRHFILREMVYWDGNKVTNRNQVEYSTILKENAVFMQTMAHTSGMKRENKYGKWFKVSILQSKSYVTWINIIPNGFDHDDFVYCVTVPSGMILVRQNGHITVTGNCDALALDEAGIENVVSVPNGAEDLTCVENCWEWLDGFKQVVLWVDNDEPGQKLERNLIQRLGAWRCSVVRHNCKDANEALLFHGKQAVMDAVDGAVAVPMEGLIPLAEVPLLDYRDVERVRSGIQGVDKVIGGFMTGELSVWTGINSSGKSTLLGQLLIEAIDQGFSVCAYSGELPARVFRYWIDLQAAGPQYLEMRHDEIRGRNVPHVDPDAVKKIRAWYKDKFYLYDSFGAAKDHKIIEVFEYAARRHGCKIFMVDNLMTTVFINNDRDFYRQQSNFIGQLKDFAHRYDVHVHVVAHPRKTSGRLTKMDVSGSGDITNRADNVFSVHRCSKEEAKENNCNTMVDIFKNRFSGQQDVSIQLIFSDQCKRFCMAGNPGGITRRYGWGNEIQGGDYSLDDF